MLKMGVGALDRVSQDCDDFDAGQDPSDPFGNQGMEDVIRAGFPGEDGSMISGGFRKVGKIPGQAFVEMEVEVVDLFSERRGHLGMLQDVFEKRSGSAALTADDDETGPEPDWLSFSESNEGFPYQGLGYAD